MDELGLPNLLRVTGLLFMTAGFLLLAKVITSHAYLGASTDDRMELTANRRYVGMWFCLPVLVIGLQMQLAAEFAAKIPASFLIIAFLALALWLLAYLLIEDLIAERMLDGRKATEARRELERATAPPSRSIEAFYQFKPAVVQEAGTKVA